jgi:uncharacterized protein YraI
MYHFNHQLHQRQSLKSPIKARSVLCVSALCITTLLLSGCGALMEMVGLADEPTATPTLMRVAVPTFTPTPVPPAATPVLPTLPPPTLPPTLVAIAPTPITTATVAVTATLAVTSAPAVATLAPAAKPKLVINEPAANLRLGPATDYGLAGSANKGQEFEVTGKNQAGDWWQLCCVNGQQAWVFAQLVIVSNADNAPVITNLPPKPVAQVAPTQPPAAAQPTTAPAQPTAAPPPASDPCANIGGDGCKFKLKGGPAFTANGGGELRLTLAFVHSGIEGGQPQGSYFVVLLKDGVNVGVPDNKRSNDPNGGMNQGPHGKFNYDHKIAAASLPGGSVAGNYTIWVLDGNGARDSQNFTFTVPDGQGEVWILFDQA